MTVRVTEIYPSIQGESTHAGLPCVFVRLTGCPLRCRWCDTVYAFRDGEKMEIDDVVAKAKTFGIDTVELTGGEPLAQPEAPALIARLCDEFGTVLLETSGAYPIAGLDPRLHVILDIKAPGSGEAERNDWSNLEHLDERDEVKFVLADRVDYDWARGVVRERAFQVPVLFSPVHGELSPRELAEWIVEDRVDARLQLQQHKYIWDPTARGV